MSDCGVCIGGYDGDVEFCDVTEHKARKEHKCGECGRIITPGERYQKAFGKCEGEIWNQKTCAECAEIRAAFTCHGGETYGILWEDMRDYAFPEINEVCFDKLKTVAAKKFLRHRWMEWKGLAA